MSAFASPQTVISHSIATDDLGTQDSAQQGSYPPFCMKNKQYKVESNEG